MSNISNKERIIQASDKLFRRFGIRSITMDDIARELGMSKKTLYQEFRNKADIVYAVSASHFEQEKQECQEIHRNTSNPIEELLTLIQWVSDSFKEIKPGMIFELQKYYPRSWQLFHSFENEFLLEVVTRNLLKGMEQGLYRQEMNPELIARMRIAQINACMDPNVFPPEKFDTTEVLVQSSTFFLHGLVTMKGKKLINQYLNRSEDE